MSYLNDVHIDVDCMGVKTARYLVQFYSSLSPYHPYNFFYRTYKNAKSMFKTLKKISDMRSVEVYDLVKNVTKDFARGE